MADWAVGVTLHGTCRALIVLPSRTGLPALHLNLSRHCVSHRDHEEPISGKLQMNFDQTPRINHGFIYILSNKSMPGIYKVGITTNSVRQRATELSSTGVPTEFSIEKIFEVEQIHLREIEKKSHTRLKTKNFHQGKEFFRAPLKEILEVVEDIIFSKTGIKAPDIVGLAAQRAEAERLRAHESYEAWKKQQAELQERQRIIQVAARKKRDREEFYKKSALEAERLAYSRIREKTESRLGHDNEPFTKKMYFYFSDFYSYVFH